ncbi:formate dehydrogenase accessory sulfurtransferase FdhD [Aeromicrobium phragmitis]|uniref:Sulfur carrier protein FdhD n=1 Tax=Aeromicrobium phragmitis TaxID=2478914 RepID=A0A3L8PS29_9ACTN|nr:formate dehydrogenase accessory sulfurtransferase FdhD [Aeromicrobium phragmitis]RLV56772.1 formate dehydrogenase accessory sulfurtransferase FdhD [Aeromicrobium phragmitis]
MTKPTQRRRIERVRVAASRVIGRDTLAAEEPLEIRVDGEQFAVTMRTPGHDFDLVAGFLVSEGIAVGADDIAAMRYCADDTPLAENTFNVIDAAIRGTGSVRAAARRRHVYTSSSCGICGLDSIEAVETATPYDLLADRTTVGEEVIGALPDRLRESQELFETTGGLHAAGIFSPDGTLEAIREDVGRHNAVDKVVGHAYSEGRLPLTGRILQVSGRASFELVQKAAMAGVPVLAAVSAPSSLAADLAERAGVTLVGFSRGATFNVYTHGDRIV